MNPKVDVFLDRSRKWTAEMTLLRNIVASSKPLTEDFKWKHPCYTLNGGNVVIIHGFKEYCALLFLKGALLKDPKSLLIQQTENVQSARQIRFTNLSQIQKLEPTLHAYLKEAIEIEQSGKKVELKKTADYIVPEEFQDKINNSKILQKAFSALTPGRQRAYLFYFGQAKQPKTRESRIKKYIPHILDGKGLDD